MKKPPLFATLLTLYAITVLCALGAWQLQRLAWKTAIIAELDSLYAQNAANMIDFDTENPRYRFGRVEGIFHPEKAILLGPTTRGGKAGHDLIVPLDLGSRALLVNLGWTDATNIADLPIHHVRGKRVRFDGLARRLNWNIFTSKNSPENDLWFRADIAEIAKAKDLQNPLPYILYAESASYKFDAAFPNNDRWYPHNKHKQYAAFWFTLAAALAVIYALRFLRP